MLNIIYAIANTSTSMITLIFVICHVMMLKNIIKEKGDLIPIIEVQIIMTKVVFAMLIVTIVIGIISENPIVTLNCVFLFIWTLCAKNAYLSLKQVKDK